MPSTASNSRTVDPNTSTSAASGSFTSQSSTSSKQAASSTQSSSKKSKKKGSSLFGFFSLKEPSTQAFADFQEETLRQATENRKRPSGIGVSGVSTTKLPASVPRVNSKWDGLPTALKEKESHQHEKDARRNSQTSSNRPLSMVFSSSGMLSRTSSQSKSSSASVHSHRSSDSRAFGLSAPAHSIRSGTAQKSTNNKPASIHSFNGSATRGFANNSAVASIKSPSLASLPEPTYFFPAEASSASGRSHSPVRTLASHGSVPSLIYSTTQSQTSLPLTPLGNGSSRPWGSSTTRFKDGTLEDTPPVPPLPSDIDLKSVATVYSGRPSNRQPFLAGEARPLEMAESESDDDLASPLAAEFGHLAMHDTAQKDLLSPDDFTPRGPGRSPSAQTVEKQRSIPTIPPLPSPHRSNAISPWEEPDSVRIGSNESDTSSSMFKSRLKRSSKYFSKAAGS
ncbi:MAG: hypothetical protein M4579_001464 [Chaenotheca gracillima]|nr:MAG: hypothetical protein M4579_001464 [Chaenotheca gracillima]